MRNGGWPEVNIAPQLLLSCDMNSDGCKSGTPENAWTYLTDRTHHMTDETCTINRGFGHSNGVECAPALDCINCTPHGSCSMVEKYQTFKVSSPITVAATEADMQKAVMGGPIVCGIDSSGLLPGYRGGVINDTTGANTIDHYVEIVGWGTDMTKLDPHTHAPIPQPYWLVRNSWGHFWGEDGFFRITRGTNNLGIETSCTYAEPIEGGNATWFVPTDEMKNDPANAQYSNAGPYPKQDTSKNKFLDELRE